jgi:hypothetical protein
VASVEGARKNASGGLDSTPSSGVAAGGQGEHSLSPWPLAKGIEGYCDRIRDSLCSQVNDYSKFRYGGSEALRPPYSDVVADGGECSAGMRDRALFRTGPLCISKDGVTIPFR